MAEAPPVLNAFESSCKDRYEAIVEKFKQKFGLSPHFLARAPGRVNIIGEHIDYCGYGVLPMAIEQDVVIAVGVSPDQTLKLSNTDPKYRDFQCDVSNFEINSKVPEWFNYFLCGLKGMTEFLSLTTPVGMTCLMDGNLPCSAGLSSSSALVCCAALATMQANGQSRSKKEIADMCAKCETYIGTMGGGMDQAISFMAQKGKAMKIDFNPLSGEDVSLPDGVAFVISNCCVEKNKAASSDFNIRVVECRLASQLIAKSRNLAWRDYKRLGDLQKALNIPLPGMEAVIREVLHEGAYTKQEVCDVLGVTEDELATTSLSANTLDVQTFQLFNRAMHVFTEASRVEDFQNTCKQAGPDCVQKLGELMNGSFFSCRVLYECSCPELDELVSICQKSGAVGSRLTGAGWGGCAVSLVPSSQLTHFLETVKQQYYVAKGLGDQLEQALFATKPGSGAAVYIVQ